MISMLYSRILLFNFAKQLIFSAALLKVLNWSRSLMIFITFQMREKILQVSVNQRFDKIVKGKNI